MTMNFKAGDSVLVIDEAISGIVSSVSDAMILVETKDGFILEFYPNELIKINEKESLKKDIFSNRSASDVLAEKEQPPRRKTPSVKPKERNQPMMEVDLHIHHLTKNDKHLTSYDKLNLQVDTAKHKLEFAIRNRIQKIVFIHGVGEGVLKLELESLFRRYENLKYYDADYQKYGLGATEVYIFQNVK